MGSIVRQQLSEEFRNTNGDWCYGSQVGPIEQSQHGHWAPVSAHSRRFWKGGGACWRDVGLAFELVGLEMDRRSQLRVRSEDTKTDATMHAVWSMDMNTSRYKVRLESTLQVAETGT